MRLTLRVLCIPAFVWFALPALGQTNSAQEITQAEIKQIINEYSQCDSLDQIAIDHLEYFDFQGNGHKDAVVVASTCMTGTAGPDVHAVYSRDLSGKLVEHSLDQLDPGFGSNGPKLPVFGNPNYGLTVEKGQLIARWMDSSDRENPLIIWYKRTGEKFAVDHMKVEGPFTTSYDAAKRRRRWTERSATRPQLQDWMCSWRRHTEPPLSKERRIRDEFCRSSSANGWLSARSSVRFTNGGWIA